MEMLSSSDNTDHIAAITLMSWAADIIYKLQAHSLFFLSVFYGF